MRVIVPKYKQEDMVSTYDPVIKLKILEMLMNGSLPSEIKKKIKERTPDARLPTKQEMDRWASNLEMEILKTKDHLIIKNSKDKKRSLPEKISIDMLAYLLGVVKAPLWERALRENWKYDANGSPRNKAMWFFIVDKLPPDIHLALRQAYK